MKQYNEPILIEIKSSPFPWTESKFKTISRKTLAGLLWKARERNELNRIIGHDTNHDYQFGTIRTLRKYGLSQVV